MASAAIGLAIAIAKNEHVSRENQEEFLAVHSLLLTELGRDILSEIPRVSIFDFPAQVITNPDHLPMSHC